MFQAMNEGYLLADVIFDDEGRSVDIEYIEANPAATRMIGTDLTGRRLREVDPDYEEYWYETFGRVAQTGQSERSVLYAKPGDIWYDFHVSKVEPTNSQSRRIAVHFFDASARVRAEAALRESEAKYRGLVSAGNNSFYRMSADWRLMYRLDSDTLAGTNEPIADWRNKYILAEDRAEVEAAIAEAIQTKSPFQLEHRVLLADGTVGWVLSRAVPLIGADGEIVEWSGAGSDVTNRKRAEVALRESEERYHALFAASPVPFMVLAPNQPDFTITAANDAYLAATLTTRETLIGRRLFDVFTDDPSRSGPKGSDALKVSLDRVLKTRQTDAMPRVRYDIVTPSGGFEPHWWLAINAPVLGASGQISTIIHQVTRVTELHHAEEAERQSQERYRESEERLQVLVAELQHRTRNLMGNVRSLADATMRASTDLEDFEGKFRDRLAALGRVQGLLSRLAETDRITFDELLRTELTAHGALGQDDRRVTLEGPTRVPLRSSTVQTLAMALHELSTNAIKYGALGTPTGKLAVVWRLEQSSDGAGPLLHVDWRESGVDMGAAHVPRPPGSGQGRELIERALPYQLKAETTFVLEDGGLHCTIVLPVSGRAPRQVN